MGLFSDDHEAYRSRQEYEDSQPHEAKLSHEVIGGAAASFAAHELMNNRAKNSQPVADAGTLRALPDLAGAFIDREVETKGLDFIDKQKARKHAEETLRREHERHGEEGRTYY